MPEELKPLPCPWCGNEPEFVKWMSGIGPMVNLKCPWADCYGPSGNYGYNDEAEAIRAWNRRKS